MCISMCAKLTKIPISHPVGKSFPENIFRFLTNGKRPGVIDEIVVKEPGEFLALIQHSNNINHHLIKHQINIQTLHHHHGLVLPALFRGDYHSNNINHHQSPFKQHQSPSLIDLLRNIYTISNKGKYTISNRGVVMQQFFLHLGCREGILVLPIKRSLIRIA